MKWCQWSVNSYTNSEQLPWRWRCRDIVTCRQLLLQRQTILNTYIISSETHSDRQETVTHNVIMLHLLSHCIHSSDIWKHSCFSDLFRTSSWHSSGPSNSLYPAIRSIGRDTKFTVFHFFVCTVTDFSAGVWNFARWFGHISDRFSPILGW